MKTKDLIQKTHKYKVGEVVTMKDGQYDAVVVELLFPIEHNNPGYLLDDGSSKFQDYETYILCGEE